MLQIKLNIIFLVAKAFLPDFLNIRRIPLGVRIDHPALLQFVFWKENIRIIGKLCLSESGIASVLLAVDIRIPFTFMQDKLLVDHRIRSLKIRIRLFKVHNERLRVQPLPDRKRDDLPVSPEHSADKSQLLHVIKRLMEYRDLLVHLLIPLFLAHVNPRIRHRAAFFYILSCHRLIRPVSRIFKAGNVIALSVQFLAGKRRKLLSCIDIVIVVPVSLD